jgi:putative hydrolase
MLLTADYHTHTKYSHGKGTVLENAVRAKELGLKELGITDHGFSHPAFGINHRKLPNLIRDVKEAKEITGVNVLTGIESNILGEEGYLDLKEKDYEYFDLFLAGAHRFIRYKKINDYFNFFLRNFGTAITKKKPSKGLIKLTTNAYVNAIKKFPVDVITHLNFLYFADAEEVAKVAADYGTYIEINSKKIHLSDEELYKVDKTKVRYLINSDAHSVDRIGDTKLVDGILERVKIDMSRIDNIEGRLPTFRFKEFKKKM